MKKFLSLISLTLCLIFVFSLTACKNEKFTYYNKTFTYTGGAEAVDWESVDDYDNFVGITDFETAEKYSKKQLLEKYFDQIDWDMTTIFGLKWGQENAPKTVDECMEKINAEIVPKIYETYKGLSLSVSGAEDLKLTITYNKATAKFVELAEGEAIVAKMAETQEQFDGWQLTQEEYMGSVDFNESMKGQSAEVLFDCAGIRTVSHFSAYKNGEELSVNAQIPTGIAEYGYIIIGDADIMFMSKPDANGSSSSVLSIQIVPEFTLTDNAQ